MIKITKFHENKESCHKVHIKSGIVEDPEPQGPRPGTLGFGTED